MRAAILFEDRHSPGLLFALRRGFRHCFLILGDEGVAMILDPTKAQTRVTMVPGESFYSLIKIFKKNERNILIGEIKDNSFNYYLSIFSCVETVKRIIGLNYYFLFTPKNLFNFMKHFDDWFEL